MLAALGAVPTRMVTRGPEPLVRLSWMRVGSVRAEVERMQLAPSIWIVRTRQWLPVSVLDVGALIPPVEGVEPVRRQFPRPAWHEQAACRAVPDADDIFFGVDDLERPALPPRATARARSYCAACPVAVECLTWALSEDERYGIWGGTTGRQRSVMRAMLKHGQTTVSVLVTQQLGGRRG